MFVIGALPALVLVPLMVRYLPESDSRVARERKPDNPVTILFRGGYLRATIAFWVTSFMGLLLVYGLNTWLPEIMRSAGYELGAALALLLVLNVGAVLGLLVAGQVADRIGRVARPSSGSRRRGVPGADQHPATGHRGLPRRAAGRGVRVQLPGAGLRVRQPPVPGRGPGHRARLGQRDRPARRDHRAADRRRPALRGDRLPVGFLRVRPGRGDRRGLAVLAVGPGTSVRDRARAAPEAGPA